MKRDNYLNGVKGILAAIITSIFVFALKDYFPLAKTGIANIVLLLFVAFIAYVFYLLTWLVVSNSNSYMFRKVYIGTILLGLIISFITLYYTINNNTLKLASGEIIITGDYSAHALEMKKEQGGNDLDLYDSFAGEVEDIWDRISYYENKMNVTLLALVFFLASIIFFIPLPAKYIKKSFDGFKGSKYTYDYPIKILFLAANPSDMGELRLEKEFVTILQKLELSREKFHLVPKFALTTKQISEVLLLEEPVIVHFSGHGASHESPEKIKDTNRDLATFGNETSEGIVLENEHGQAKLVSNKSLTNLFEHFSNKIECVILNSCYSKNQAKAIALHIPFVIGMSTSIPDHLAIDFSATFYQALGKEQTIKQAFSFAKDSMTIQNPGLDLPVLYEKRTR